MNYVITGRFCGSEHPLQPVKSSGSRMLVTYITSHKQNGHRGFVANYEGKNFQWELRKTFLNKNFYFSCMRGRIGYGNRPS
jgi:hypothetical protein